MDKLTKPAREYCKASLAELPREELVQKLEAICVACYDDDDIDDLLESAVDSIEARDIDFDWSYASARCQKHHIHMLWLDIDEIWE